MPMIDTATLKTLDAMAAEIADLTPHAIDPWVLRALVRATEAVRAVRAEAARAA